MPNIRFAIVGCGHIAKKHAEAIKNTEGAELVAVCDTIPANMEFYTSEYGAKPYINYDEMILNQEIDVINICTPSGSHAPLTIKAANAGKHVVVEKPIALSLKDTDSMIEACEKNNVKMAVLHPNRFRPAMLELRKAMDEGRFGKLSHANATVRWNRDQAYFDQAPWRGTKEFDGGVLMNQAIHNLDLLVWMMGDVEEVYSMAATRFRKIEAEDVSTGVVRFKNGSLGVIEAATTIYPKNFEESLSIFGESGTVKIGGKTANFVEHWQMESIDEEAAEKIKAGVKENPFGKPGHQWIIEDMIMAIKEDREPVVNGTEGKKALELVLALYESAESGQPVKISNLRKN